MESFSALLTICAGNSPVTGEFTTQRPVTLSFDFSLICVLNKRLSKQSRGWWFETPSHPLWRHCDAISLIGTWINTHFLSGMDLSPSLIKKVNVFPELPPAFPDSFPLTHWVRDKMDDIFKCIFLDENLWISINISLNFVSKDSINNIPALVQMMAPNRCLKQWWPSLLTHICVTRR